MDQNNETNFPDQIFLDGLVLQLQKKVTQNQTPADRLLTLSGVGLNWIGEYIADTSFNWSLETLQVDDLYLTGTGPEQNRIIIEKCERSPKKLRQLLKSDPSLVELFSSANFDDYPILVRYEEEKYKVLDGMHRTIAAIRDDKSQIQAFVARPQGKPMPKCEPHVVYDFLRSYQRKINPDRVGLIAALRFLRHSYVNVDDLLRDRFNKSRLADDEIQQIIQEALKD